MFFGIKVSKHLLLRIQHIPLVFLFENNRHKHLTPVGSHQYCLLMLWKNFTREGILTNTLAGTVSYSRIPFPGTNRFTTKNCLVTTTPFSSLLNQSLGFYRFDFLVLNEDIFKICLNKKN